MKTIGRVGIVVVGSLLLSVMGCSDGKDHIWRAEVADKAGRFDEAIRQYTLAIESEEISQSDLVKAHFGRGLVCRKKGNSPENLENAIMDFSRVIALDPEHVEAYGERGKAYYINGESARAEADSAKEAELRASDFRRRQEQMRDQP